VSSLIFPLILVVIAFMLYTTYSQQRRAKRAQEQLQRMVKKGDEVLTVGGMFGTVRKVADDYVVLEVADRTRVRFLRRAIREIVNEEEDVDEDEEEYVDDEYVDDEAEGDEEYDEAEGDEQYDEDEDDEEYVEAEGDDESDEAEDDEEDAEGEADDGKAESDEPGGEAAADAVDQAVDGVTAPKPPTPPKGG
jgi:preprotein translocase subunit YajC